MMPESMVRLFGPNPEKKADLREKQTLLEEIRAAHAEWMIAQHKLNYATDHEQIDYVVYLIEAAEKRYEMLLKQAKHIHLNALEADIGPNPHQFGGWT